MRVAVVAALVAAVGATLAPSPLGADGGYGPAARVETIERALGALESMTGADRRTLQRELYQGARRECRAAFGAPTVGCVLEMARATCARWPEADRQACRLAADVIVVNQLGAEDLIDRKTRFRLMNEGTDFHQALQAELEGRYATLAAELVLDGPATDSLAGDIDGFCSRHARSHGLGWSRCVAALVWYIGSEGGQP